MELTVVLLQEKAAQPTGQIMEPENITEIISALDHLSDLYSHIQSPVSSGLYLPF